MMHWFSSDYHLGHENIIEYTNRPFKDLKKMDAAIIRNHNQRVKPTDTVFFLGDFCFRNTKGGKPGEGTENKAEYYLSKLNGRFVFIQGNHDHSNSLNTPITSAVIELGGREINLVHNPEHYDPSFEINFVGHVHERWKFRKVGRNYLVNVGCDVWGYMPVNINEILAELEKWRKDEHD
jgi:calcineurin-like phosphoesterase family protein